MPRETVWPHASGHNRIFAAKIDASHISTFHGQPGNPTPHHIGCDRYMAGTEGSGGEERVVDHRGTGGRWAWCGT